MISGWKKISEGAMLRNWALAEVATVRRQRYLDGRLPNDLIRKIRSGHFDFTDEEYSHLVEMIKSNRSDLLAGLLGLDFEWYEGKLPIEALKNMEMMNWPPFVNLAGSRKLIDLVLSFKHGKMPPNHNEFAENLERIRADFKLENMLGKPIVLIRSKESPYVLVEGFTRLSALLLNVLEGKEYGEELPIILGVSQRLSEWEYA